MRSKTEHFRRLASVSLLLILASLGAGCGQQVVYQTATQPVRLAESVKAYVWVRQNGQWVKSGNRITIPQGFDVLPPPTTQP